MQLRPIRVPARTPQTQLGARNPVLTRGRSLAKPSIATRPQALAREHFAGPSGAALNRLQDKTLAAIQAIAALPFGNGQLLPGCEFTGGTPLAISHGLGGEWAGYLVLNVQAGAAIFAATPAPATDAYTIHITATNTCTADVWVYA